MNESRVIKTADPFRRHYNLATTSAGATFSAAANAALIDFTQSYGAVRTGALSRTAAARLQFEIDMVAEVHGLSLARAQADADRALEIAHQQKAKAVGDVVAEHPALMWPVNLERDVIAPCVEVDVRAGLADRDWSVVLADAEAGYESGVAALRAGLETTLAGLEKNAEVAGAALAGALQVAEAGALAAYWSAETAAANDHFQSTALAMVDWWSADYAARQSALVATFGDPDDPGASPTPWETYLVRKAQAETAWWTTSGSAAYLTWVQDTCDEHTAYTTTASTTTYLGTVAATTTAGDAWSTADALAIWSHEVDKAQTASQAAGNLALAAAEFLKSGAAAKFGFAQDADQAAFDAGLSAAKLTYQQEAAASAGTKNVSDALAGKAYVDAVYAEDGPYDAWQAGAAGAVRDYELAESAARQLLGKNLSAHDAALAVDLAGSYAAAMDDLATSYPSPWSARAAADAQAEADRTSAEHAARLARDEAIADAVAAFEQIQADATFTKLADQAGAQIAFLQVQSAAALTAASDQAAANNQLAATGADPQPAPTGDEPPAEPGDATEVAGDGSLDIPPPPSLHTDKWIQRQIETESDAPMNVAVSMHRVTLVEGNRSLPDRPGRCVPTNSCPAQQSSDPHSANGPDRLGKLPGSAARPPEIRATTAADHAWKNDPTDWRHRRLVELQREWAFEITPKNPDSPEKPRIRIECYRLQGSMYGPFFQAPRQDTQVVAKAFGLVPGVGALTLGIDAGIHVAHGEYEEALLSGFGAGLNAAHAVYAAASTDEVAGAATGVSRTPRTLPPGFDPAKGFASFDDFKEAFGAAGQGQAWHHVVEQTINSGKFAPEILHNPANLFKMPHGKGTVHAKISGYYLSKIPGLTGNKTVREWLSTKSFQEQFDFGIDVIKQFGGSQYLPPHLR